LLESPEVYRPHPFVDYPAGERDNILDPIPKVTYSEVLKVLVKRKKKRSCDLHGLSPFLIEQIPRHYWHLLHEEKSLYNMTFKRQSGNRRSFAFLKV
jgi:hypothetical protein